MSILKRIIIFVLIGFTGVFLCLTLFLIQPFSKTRPFAASEYEYGLEYYKELGGISIMAQETEYTCFIVSMAIVRHYFGTETTEHDVRSELDMLNRSTGMLPNEYVKYAGITFEPLSYSISMLNPKAQAEILNIISRSLENDLPVVFFYAAPDDWNRPHYNTHYSVIYGIDMKNEIVKISNPYGYLEELSFSELYNGLDFASYEAEPFIFRLARKAGIVKSNSLFVFEKSF